MDHVKQHYEVILTSRRNLAEYTAARCRSFEEARGLARELLASNPLRPVRAWVREVRSRP